MNSREIVGIELEAMQKAITLAKKAGKNTFPNPLVGAVVLRDGEILSEGYHRSCGEPHAEIEALELAGEQAQGAILAVTLEPCCHQGKTGPCTDRIIQAGIKKVIIAHRDPNPEVNGRGIDQLRRNGIAVIEGLLEKEAALINETYFHFLKTGRSLVHLKLAQSFDGKIAAPDGGSRWISCEQSRRTVHRMRADSHAVLIGAGTVRNDNPQLTIRHPDSIKTNQPARIVVSGSGNLKTGSKIFNNDAPTVIAVPESISKSCRKKFEAAGAVVWMIEEKDEKNRLDLSALLRRTADEGWGTILCEGGSVLSTDLVQQGLVSRLSLFVAPLLMGGNGLPSFADIGVRKISEAVRLRDLEIDRSGDDILLRGRFCSQD